MMDAFVRLPDFASRALGGAVVDANDDFVADRAALIIPALAQPRAEFGHRGKDFPSTAELAAAEWTTLVPRSAAKGDTTNVYDVDDSHRWTHVKLVISPTAEWRGVVDTRLTWGEVTDRGMIAECIRCSSTITWTPFSNVVNLFGTSIWRWPPSSANEASC